MKIVFGEFSVHKWISIGFPVYLIVFEILLRQVSKVDISSFLGPTLASSGLGFLIESLKPKKVVIPESIKDKLESLPDDFTIRYKGDEKLIYKSIGFLLICVLIWFYTCALSIQPSTKELANKTGGLSLLSMAFVLGCLNYVIGIVFSTLKGE